MKSLIVPFIFLSSIFLLPSASFANVKIGNGGEGLEIDGQVRLRDFVTEDGRYIAPVIAKSDAESPNEAIFPSSGMEYDVSLLMRVVARINSASPLLAEAVLNTAGSCWYVVDGALWLPNPRDNFGIGLTPRIPIAVRGFPFLPCIAVNKHVWKKLSEIDKIGLIVHETVSALLKPTCHLDWCGQDAAAVRHLVHLIFYADMAQLRSTIHGLLNQLGLEQFKRKPTLGLERVTAFSKPNNQRVKLLDAIDPITLGPRIPSLVEQVCKQAEIDAIEVELTRPSKCVFRNVVVAGNQRQVVTRPGTRRGFKIIYLRPLPYADCSSQLSERLERWFGITPPEVRECF